MNEDMENNIQNTDNMQYFSDTTYYVIPPYNKSYKLWILLTFNKKFMKTLLCCMALIKNENKETITKIFVYLNLKYNFKPNIISMDFGRGPYKAVIHKYPNCRIFPCFFSINSEICITFTWIKI